MIYGADGYLSEKREYLSRGVFKTRFVYTKRDKYGNWTRRLTYHINDPIIVTERTIEYYD